MRKKTRSTGMDQEINLRIQELEDEQLKDVLKKRKLYQKEAADAAIREAIKREIISSENDLHGPDYRHESLKVRLFPVIENPNNKNRIRRSISRGLLLAGLLPTVWGMVRLNAGASFEGMLLLVYGLLWMGASALLIRKFSTGAVRFLFASAAVSTAYIIRWFIGIPRIVFMDLFIVVVLYSLMIYGLFFVLRLKE